ncbi:hypothetical protein QLX67_08995 [Balneolaceae bacterium ANBcel3]|nr:hypothetical protein [Balneolaceae bacterium ANBcel3]
MEIQNLISLTQNHTGKEKEASIQKEKTAVAFEELFARHLVRELTKDAFDMSDNFSETGQSNALYKEFITEALAGELAKQQKLGMAELVMKYWDRKNTEEDFHHSGEKKTIPLENNSE